MRAIGGLLIALVLILGTPARGGMVIRCSPPEGPALNYGHQVDIQGNTLRSEEDGFSETRDGFRQMSPTFVFDEANPSILWSLWGSMVPLELTKAEVEAISPTKMRQTAIILNSGTLLTSVAVYPEEVWLNSFYPELGVAYFTRHKRLDLLGRIAMASLLYSKCDFIDTR